jgi:hypothetical protein
VDNYKVGDIVIGRYDYKVGLILEVHKHNHDRHVSFYLFFSDNQRGWSYSKHWEKLNRL